MIRIILLCFITYASPVFAQKQLYSMEDLKILEKTQEYKEFFQHAKDILPVQRNDEWNGIVQNMGQKYLDHLTGLPELSYKTIQEVEELFNWSILKSDEFFRMARYKIGLKYFHQCFKVIEHMNACTEQMQLFYIRDKSSPEFGLELGKIIFYTAQQIDEKSRSSISGELNPWPYYQAIAQSELGEFHCDKDYFYPEIKQRLEQEAIRTSEPKALEKRIDNLIHKDCWKALVPKLTKQMVSDFLGRRRDLAFSLLRAKNALTTDTKSQYLMLHLLEGPDKGEITQMAWSWLKQVRLNYQQRESLVEHFRSLGPLPGKIFSKYQDKQANVIIKYLNTHFPEYMDLYTQTCLSYLGGEREFPNGNPTLECHDLFKFAKEAKLIPQPLILKYDNYTKFTR